MKALVVGLGSMGKRRIRNLRAIGLTEIAGADPRQDRREEAASRYAIRDFASIDEATRNFSPDIVVISTSPDLHMLIASSALEKNLPCFIEASVVDAERVLELHRQTEATPLLMAPSCTMRYFPGPKKVKELIRLGVIGKPLNVNYQTGQYLPDWHPWEGIEDYYVSKRATGGCREIVPFELTWLNDIFGMAEPLACVKSKVSNLSADIDDIYHCLLRYPHGVLANICVEVLSRPRATRELRVLGSSGELIFSADQNCVRYANVENPGWTEIDLGVGSVEAGYINPEEPYIAEMRDFVEAVRQRNKKIFPNTLLDDYNILQLLLRLETLSEKNR